MMCKHILYTTMLIDIDQKKKIIEYIKSINS